MRVTLRDRAVLLDDTLVLADLHVGKGVASNVDLPLGEREHLTGRFEALLEQFEPAEVVVAGDLLHSFDRVPAGVQGTLSVLTELAREAGTGLVVTPGNHDTMLETLWDGPTEHEYDLGTVPLPDPTAEREGRVVVCHGHVEPATPADCYVIGHDHPTITIEGRKWHCYLHGRAVHGDADVFVLPAFTHLAAGVSINRGRGTATFSSPLVADLGAFRPIVRDDERDETRAFPLLSEFRDLL